MAAKKVKQKFNPIPVVKRRTCLPLTTHWTSGTGLALLTRHRKLRLSPRRPVSGPWMVTRLGGTEKREEFTGWANSQPSFNLTGEVMFTIEVIPAKRPSDQTAKTKPIGLAAFFAANRGQNDQWITQLKWSFLLEILLEIGKILC